MRVLGPKDVLRQVVAAMVGLALISAPLLVIIWGWGCKDSSNKVFHDGPVKTHDGGANCDVIDNKWKAQTLTQAASTGNGDELANLFGVWGASEKAVWAVGSRGKIIFYDGKEWKSQEAKTTEMLTSVWGTAKNDVWAVGYNGKVLHFNGSQWIDRSPGDIVFVTTDGGVPKGDAAVGLRKNLWGVWVAGKVNATTQLGVTSDVFIVGDNGLILHFNNTNKLWTKGIPIYAGGTQTKLQDQLNAVWGSSATNVFIAGNFGTILRGGKARFDKQQTGITKDLHGIWGRSGSDVYALGTTGTILRYLGSDKWSPVKGAPKQVLRGIWGPANNSSLTYLIGWDGTLLRLTGGPSFGNGATFDPFYCVIPQRRLEGIWGTLVTPPPPDAGFEAGPALVPAVWVVGASGTVISGP